MYFSKKIYFGISYKLGNSIFSLILSAILIHFNHFHITHNHIHHNAFHHSYGSLNTSAIFSILSTKSAKIHKITSLLANCCNISSNSSTHFSNNSFTNSILSNTNQSTTHFSNFHNSLFQLIS
ncbi:hypothetical protein HOG21_05500 [bacterium]|nr:hypothetical protein [bacterium]